MSDDIHALSGAYAVDALDEDERAQVEQHLAACADCRSEVASLREASALLAELTLLTPRSHLREQVLAGISTVRPLPPLVEHRVAAKPETAADRTVETTDAAVDDDAQVVSLAPRRRRRTAALLAAAAAVVAVGTGGVVWQQSGGSDDQVAGQSAAHAVETAPDHETYAARLGDGMTATVYRSDHLNQAVLVTHGFPVARSGKEYVLWLIHDGTAVPAGVLPDAADNEIVLSGDAATATSAGITVEDAGTSPSSPSGPMVANIAFQET